MQNPFARESSAGKSKDYFSLSVRENEYRINRISGCIAVVAQLLVFLMLIMNFTNIFILDSVKMMSACLLILPFTLSVIIFTLGLRVEKPWVKYFITGCDSIVITLLFAFLSMHTVLLFVYPLVKSCLYFKRKVTSISAVLSFASLLLGHLLSVPLSIVFDDPLVQSFRSAMLYGFVPRFVELFIIALVIRLLTGLTSKTVGGGYAYARQIERMANEEKKSNFEIVKNLATISENKSSDTGEHIARVFDYMNVLAHKAGYSEEECYDVSLAAMLHDVGKLCIDEKILSKPARLTPEEFEEVKKHASLGKSLLSNSDNAVLEIAARIADQHHERWDGNGYHHMIGEQIDRLSCLMSVVDVFDALTSKRCYKEAWSLEDAYAEIVKGKGTQFSPEAVDLFVACYDDFVRIYHLRKDTPAAKKAPVDNIE